MVPAGMARLQLRRLRRLGWDLSTIARRVGVSTLELDELGGTAETCTARLTLRLTAVARHELTVAEAVGRGAPPGRGVSSPAVAVRRIRR